jgi:O-antigen ligase
LALAAVAAVVVAAVVTAVYLDSGAGLSRGIGAGVSGDFSTGRTHFWSVALQIFLAHPIIGAGLDAFGVAFTRYDTWNGTFRVEQAHNDYLQTLADSGLLGFACLVSFLGLFVRRAMSSLGGNSDGLMRGVAVGAFAGCTGILVHSFFDFPLRTPANGFFFLLLLAIMVRAATSRAADTTDRSRQPI